MGVIPLNIFPPWTWRVTNLDVDNKSSNIRWNKSCDWQMRHPNCTPNSTCQSQTSLSPGTYQDFRWMLMTEINRLKLFRELTGYSELLFLAEVIVVGIEVVWTGRCKLRRFRNFCSCMDETLCKGQKKPSCWAKTSDNPGFEICTANHAQNKQARTWAWACWGWPSLPTKQQWVAAWNAQTHPETPAHYVKNSTYSGQFRMR